MSSSELQALFSSLRPRTQDRASILPSPAAQSDTHQLSAPQSFVPPMQVPSMTPPLPPPSNPSDSARVNEGATQEHPANHTARSLLNLLNRSASPPHSITRSANMTPDAQIQPSGGLSTISASDLVAKFMSPSSARPQEQVNLEASSANATPNQLDANPLLNLLGKHRHQDLSKSAIQSLDDLQHTDVVEKEAGRSVLATDAKARDSNSAVEAPSTMVSAQPVNDISKAQPQNPLFTYTNPFEALNASRSQTPKTSGEHPATEQHEQTRHSDPKGGDLAKADLSTEISTRKKLTPKLRSKQYSTSPPPQPPQDVDGAIALTTVARPFVADHVAENDVERGTSPMQPKAEKVPVSELPKETAASAGEWEDVPDKEQNRLVPVLSFPIKAFVSITLHLSSQSDVGVRQDGIMDISRLKKDFDQIDRSLATATSKYITYGFAKHGGIRIIRQDDGLDRHVFKNTHDRIFNVSFCSTESHAPLSEHQAILGTGVSGAVYYVTVCREGNDLFEKNQLEAESLIFPPSAQADENVTGGVLKTRAKRSSRHPEFFAIGRGKSINIIWPATLLSSRYGITDTNRTVEIGKYLQDRTLQVHTGKAGKDFTFSEDDTMIVSLDKTGRLRFWDIQPLVDESNALASKPEPRIVDTPVLSLSTASQSEKSWPTSVLFVDKARPYNKGGALRYVLVGSRQNHTLQLWDIALGKAVQELNFPHGTETDAICSVNYHPGSAIISVGHPTRNSIFFIHLSAPRYTMSPSVTQSSYVSRVASKDADLPKPESTACMSGIREISFAQKGHLRSVELLHVHRSPDNAKTRDDASLLFELYVAHSKGVTCLGISKEDLGWNPDNKIIHNVDALKEGLVTIKDLKLGSVIEDTASSRSPPPETNQPPARTAKKKAKKYGHATEDGVKDVELEDRSSHHQFTVTEPYTESTVLRSSDDVAQDTDTKKSKKKPALAMAHSNSGEPPKVTSKVDVTTSHKNAGDHESTATDADSNMQGKGPQVVASEKQVDLKGLERTLSEGLRKELEQLQQALLKDRSAQDQLSNERHQGVLRLVSESLSNNVEISLARIVSQQIQQNLVPAVTHQFGREISETLKRTILEGIPREFTNQLPLTVERTFKSPHMTRAVSDSITASLIPHLERHLENNIPRILTPLLKTTVESAAIQIAHDVEARTNAQIQQLQSQRAADADRFDRFSQALETMGRTLDLISSSQITFQEQFLRDRQQVSVQSAPSVAGSSQQVSTARSTSALGLPQRPASSRLRSKEQIEFDEITALMNEGRYEEGSVRWLQSTESVRLFDELFVKFTPEYLATDVSPLVAFSVAVTVATSLTTYPERRLEWIAAAFDAVDLRDPEVADLAQHAPALITSLVQKLESLYMSLAERDPADVTLRLIPPLAKKARDMRAAFTARNGFSVPALG